MGAVRSLRRVPAWAAALVCLITLCSSFMFGATRTVSVRDSFFEDTTPDGDGSSTTSTIAAGDTVTWSWSPVTALGHTTTSGNTCCTGDGKWDSANLSQTSGAFTPAVGTFNLVGDYPYFCKAHGLAMSGLIRVNPGPLHHFLVVASVTSITAGNSFNVAVTAQDQFNNIITSYAGTVHIDSSDPNDTMPGNITLPGGTGTFTGVILRTAGSQSITVNDTVLTTKTGSDNVTVNPAVASQLALAAPAASPSGVVFVATVTARDQFNNLATGYGGTVQFTSSDSSASLPANDTVPGGTRNFNVTLTTAGLQSITVTDTGNGALTDTANVNVGAACSISFSNTTPITINDFNISPPSVPYPSTIVVGGLKPISGMSVTMSGVNHAFGRDIDVLLVGPGGQKMVILSDSGGNSTVNNSTITLTDSAGSLAPDVFPSPPAPLVSGAFKPTNNLDNSDNRPGNPDSFPATAPTPPPAPPYSDPARTGTATFASTFGGTDPNGAWSLYITDDQGGGTGSVAGGWSLTFSYPNTFCNQTPITVPDDGTANPYPSAIDVSGVDGTVKNLSVRLAGLAHTFRIDLDLLLVSPGGKNMIILSDVGGTASIRAEPVVITLDDSAATGVPPDSLVSGVFRPTGLEPGDSFPPPAPGGPYPEPAPAGKATFGGVFKNIDPNGTWNLYVVDDSVHARLADGGSIASGWTLSFDVVFNTTTTLGSNLNPSTFGQAVTFTANVTSSGGTPTGTVTFKDGGIPLGIGPQTLSGGTAQLTVSLAAGTHNITAEYGGDANFHASTSSILVQTVTQAATTTAVGSSLNPSTFGQSVTFTATVSDSTTFTPTGTVTFKDGLAPLGTIALNASAQATFTTSALTGGSHSITAVYNGDANFATGTSPSLAQTVNKANTTTAVVSGTNPSTYGGSVTFTATVSDSTSGVPTGSVAFKDGATTIGTGTLNGSAQATFTTSALTGGGHSITAVYAGDGNFNTSTSPAITQTVNKATPTASVISFQNPSTFSQDVLFRADVLGTGVTPTGNVTFKDGLTTLRTEDVKPDGTALFNTATLGGGNHNITAVYNGDGNYNTATSTILVQQVLAADTSTGLGSSLNPSTFSQSVTFTATVTSFAGTPAGTVTFKDGLSTLGTSPLNGAGVATLLTSALSPGSHSITAVYNNNADFATSTSAPLTQTVNQASTTTTVGSSANPSTFGASVTFTATVNDTVPGNASGTVTFKDGATTIGTGTLNGASPPQATFTTATLTGGGHSITAVYGGNTNFITSTSSILTQTVNKAASTTALSSSDTTTLFGELVTFTATVTGPGATPTGSVTFKDGLTTLSTVALVSGVATFNTTTLSSGSHNITAEYGGNGNLNNSTSSVVVQTVGQSATIISIAASKNTSGFREAVTFTVTVSSTTSGTPTGTVTFLDGATNIGSGSLNGSGQMQITVSRMTIGRHSITVQYGGDVNFPVNSSAPLVHYRSPRPR